MEVTLRAAYAKLSVLAFAVGLYALMLLCSVSGLRAPMAGVATGTVPAWLPALADLLAPPTTFVSIMGICMGFSICIPIIRSGKLPTAPELVADVLLCGYTAISIAVSLMSYGFGEAGILTALAGVSLAVSAIFDIAMKSRG
jgi:hypothetical protein